MSIDTHDPHFQPTYRRRIRINPTAAMILGMFALYGLLWLAARVWL